MHIYSRSSSCSWEMRHSSSSQAGYSSVFLLPTKFCSTSSSLLSGFKFWYFLCTLQHLNALDGLTSQLLRNWWQFLGSHLCFFESPAFSQCLPCLDGSAFTAHRYHLRGRVEGRTWYSLVVESIQCPFFCFFGCACGMWKFPGQGLNPSHSSDLSCTRGNAESLTYCATRELLHAPSFVCLFVCLLFRAPGKAYGSFWARVQNGAAAADLHHSSQQCHNLNPLSEARDRTCILIDPSWVPYCWVTKGTPSMPLFYNNFYFVHYSWFSGFCQFSTAQ